MSRYLPDPSIPVADLGRAVHAALDAAREAGAPLLALAYPPQQSGASWHVTALEAATSDVRFGFHSGSPEWDRQAVEREFRRRGYDSLAGMLRQEWTELPDGGRCTHLFSDPHDPDDWWS
ncbi:hypothetical protein F7Q99_39720 [Streptomyces kaniharaensis]|uniref:Uncharacterized protein n=1 Tax=Streptomyces kaniharaensis TaxID=212423 RepID=A0A6N7L2Q5_9ACTN|nr:hypothetical protein [Streptomyces kaniharaensis]MQS18152.1 hypothetical protein [Streptomyces kaniharaensis]